MEKHVAKLHEKEQAAEVADEPKLKIQEKQFLNLKKEGSVEVENSEILNVPMEKEKESSVDALDTKLAEVPESEEQQVPETSGSEASDEQTTEKHVTKLHGKGQVSKVREKTKSDTEGMEFIKVQNEMSTEVENVETLDVSIGKESDENVPDPQQIKAPESGKLEVLERSVCETSDGQETDASDVEKAAKTEDHTIPEIRVEDFCDAQEVEGGSLEDEGNVKQNLEEDQVFKRFVQDAFGWMLQSHFSAACTESDTFRSVIKHGTCLQTMENYTTVHFGDQ